MNMNRITLLFICIMSFTVAFAQNASQNQNPNYRKSQEQYERVADSINSLQGSTSHRTYKAIDYLADKAEAKQLRQEQRHELRMQRARWGYSNWNVGWYPSYRFGYGYGIGYGRGWNRPIIYTRF